VPMGGLAISTARVPADAEGEVTLSFEALSDGVSVRGRVEVPWEGECRRCLSFTSGILSAGLDEIFKDDPDEGEMLPVDGDAVDLGPVVHDAVILALPLAPLCSEDCRGPKPEEFPVVAALEESAESGASEPPTDPRWAALDELRFDSGDGE
jgi:uncharacterized protein